MAAEGAEVGRWRIRHITHNSQLRQVCEAREGPIKDCELAAALRSGGVGEVGERKRAVAQGGVWYRAESG